MDFVTNLENHAQDPDGSTRCTLVREAEEMLALAWKIANSDGWKTTKEKSNGDVVEVKVLPTGRKAFKASGIIDLPPRILFKDHGDNLQEVPSWDSNVVESHVVREIDDSTRFIYQIIAEQAAGIISQRDYVILAKKAEIEGNLIYAGASHDYAGIPERKGIVRADNGPGCWIVRPVSGNENQCIFEWLLDTDQKLSAWIPQSVVDSATVSVMLNHLSCIRDRALTLQNLA